MFIFSIVITGNICARSTTFPSLIYRRYRYRRYTEDRYTGVLSHTFYYNYCWANKCWSLYQEYCYSEDRFRFITKQTRQFCSLLGLFSQKENEFSVTYVCVIFQWLTGCLQETWLPNHKLSHSQKLSHGYSHTSSCSHKHSCDNTLRIALF